MNQFNQKEAFRSAKEKAERIKAENKRKEEEYFKKITSGPLWTFFKVVVVACTLTLIATTIDTFVDGKEVKISDSQWERDRKLYKIGYQSVWVGNALFAPSFEEWIGHVDGTYSLTYSPIFQNKKKLNYDQELYPNRDVSPVRRVSTIRVRTIYTWFPLVQIALAIPLLTFLLRKPKPWFNFLRVFSMVLIFPGMLVIIAYLLM